MDCVGWPNEIGVRRRDWETASSVQADRWTGPPPVPLAAFLRVGERKQYRGIAGFLETLANAELSAREAARLNKLAMPRFSMLIEISVGWMKIGRKGKVTKPMPEKAHVKSVQTSEPKKYRSRILPRRRPASIYHFCRKVAKRNYCHPDKNQET